MRLPLHRRLLPPTAALALLWGAGAAVAQNRPSFTGVGDLAGGAFDSSAEAVSDDGAVVVGGSDSTSGPQAFRWTAAGGIVGLGDLPGGVFNSAANGVSANGSVIVGTGVNSSDESRAFRWTSGGGMVALNALTCFLCDDFAFGNKVSANGLVAVGGSNPDSDSLEATRWTGGGTSISALGWLSGGGSLSEARAASSTGSLIVGTSDATAGQRAFRWTTSGIVALPDIAGAMVKSAANDVSDDGGVIVGESNANPGDTGLPRAVRWLGPSYTTALQLGQLPGATFPSSRALGVSANGAIIVGIANDAESDDAAFVWDATHGMRELATVLAEDYGLDLGAWRLVEAHGVSNVNAAGEYWIVGAGINPSGNPEGFVALLSPTACNDGVDNDGDGQIDFGHDLQCIAKGDRSETADCGDGLDNDADGQTDYPTDTGCTSATDRTEKPDCGDGIDDDGDGQIDFPADLGCRKATSPVENPACQNGIDDDGDGAIDFPADKQCVAADDRSEIPDCSDGIDNDGDGAIDSPSDADCTGSNDPAEDAQCDDRIDNDADGVLDFPNAYPNCTSAADTTEKAQCGDALDNDGDGPIDFPADAGCGRASFASEAPVTTAVGDLLVLDQRSRSLFRLNMATGVQTPLSSGAQLTAPQGVAVRSSGAVVVADPAGLFEVAPSSGVQRRFSAALDTNLSLQTVFDASGNVLVLESTGITQVPFVYGGIAAQTPLLTLPAGGTSLTVFIGDSLAREAAGTLLVTGFGTMGDGVFRISANGSTVTHVTPSFSGDTWHDLAVEASGQILAVGTRFGVGTGVFRIHPTTGARTALSTTSWVDPRAVVVNASGTIFVADAGTCTTASCTGAQVVQVDPVTGARSNVRSGGSITGEMDLAVVSVKPVCSNGVNDDGDAGTDFPADAECRTYEDPSEAADCANGLDDDGDGLTDAPADVGCLDASSTPEDPACDDGIDNDGDGKIDWDGGPGGATPDPQCTTPSKNKEKSSSCGLGFEVGIALALLARRGLRVRGGATRERARRAR
jgi:probable HAF family extracellular repeat protein